MRSLAIGLALDERRALARPGAINGGNGGMLYGISGGVADSLVGASAETFKSPVKILVGGLSKKFIKMV